MDVFSIITNHGSKAGVVTICIVYMVLCPYTKVEESFNLQAVHDHLYHGVNFTEYDHHYFPGVVPRTFIGPLSISILSYPSVSIISLLNGSKFVVQKLVRFWIICLVMVGVCKFSSAVHQLFGRDVVQHFILITLTQFHFLFYASRPLPNTFALILALPAFASWLKQNYSKFIWISAFAIIIFRFELCIILGSCLLISILQGNVSFKSLLYNALPAGITALCFTVCIDSILWERWLWPEGDVMWFNIVLNKSSNWGTSPFYWYFTSALPRALLTSSVLIPWGLRCDIYRCSVVILPAVFFVLIFSFLPHKELRFIIYTIPLFNVVAARGYADLKLRINKSNLWKICYVASLVLLIINAFACFMFLSAAMHNYPGGVIMKMLHDEVPCSKSHVHVHISNYAAQTGVTRFTEMCPHWRYNKTENLSIESIRMDETLTHVIAECDDDDGDWLNSHVRVGEVDVFSGITISKILFGIPYPVIRTSPSLILWQRKEFITSHA